MDGHYTCYFRFCAFHQCEYTYLEAYEQIIFFVYELVLTNMEFEIGLHNKMNFDLEDL